MKGKDYQFNRLWTVWPPSAPLFRLHLKIPLLWILWKTRFMLSYSYANKGHRNKRKNFTSTCKLLSIPLPFMCKKYSNLPWSWREESFSTEFLDCNLICCSEWTHSICFTNWDTWSPQLFCCLTKSHLLHLND